MRAKSRITGIAAIAILAAACGGEICECETPEGEPAEVDVPSSGSCESLAGEGTPYLFCYARGQALSTAPSDARPVTALSAALDSLAAAPERPLALPDRPGARR